MNCNPAGTIYEERVVKWFELELIFWGDGYIYTEGTKIKTELGDLFFRTPGMIVQGVSPYHCYLIVFDMFYDRNKADLYKDTNILNADIHSSELANIAELSPNFLCKVFKNIIGLTPIEYVNNTKIICAKRFLIESNKSIKEIAYECGFENDSYFYTLFKKTEGISPSAYREKQRIIFPG